MSRSPRTIAIDPLPLRFAEGKRFVVYLYRDPRKGKKKAPIYVGKGSILRGRPDFHWNGLNNYNFLLNAILGKIRDEGLVPIVEVIAGFDDEESAFHCEMELIKRFGRRDLQLGTLCNLTDGGEGAAGREASTYTKLKQREKALTRWTPEERLRYSLAAIERWAALTPEERRKEMHTRLGSPTPQERTLRARHAALAGSPEQRSERSRKATSKLTPEQRRANSRSGGLAAKARSTPEERIERARTAAMSLTPEQRRAKSSAAGIAANTKLSPQQKAQKASISRKNMMAINARLTPQERREKGRVAGLASGAARRARNEV